MHFADLDNGEYRVHAGSMELCAGEGFIAAVVSRHHSGQTAAHEVYRDTALSWGHRWATSEQALERALLDGTGAVKAERRRIASREGGTLATGLGVA